MGATGIPSPSVQYEAAPQAPPAVASTYLPIGTSSSGTPLQGPVDEHHRFGFFRAPVTTSFLAPAINSLYHSRRWSEEPFPFAWFVTPIFDFVSPDSLVFLAGYETSGVDNAFRSGARSVPDTPEEAARKTVALGSAICGMGLLMMFFPAFPTVLVLRLGGAVLVVASGFLMFMSFTHSLPDFIVGLNLLGFSLIMIFFRRIGGFLLANVLASWLVTKGFCRSCVLLSVFVGISIIIASMFTSSIIGFLLGYDCLLCGIRVVATGKRMATSEPNTIP